MTLLIIGVLLFVIMHLVPTLARPLRQSLIDKLGENPYRGLFSLVMIAAISFIVLGWRSIPDDAVYVLSPNAKTFAFILMCISFLLIGVAHHPSSVKRVVRHPMLLGVTFWSVGHLVANGSTRAIILFGSLGIWSLLEIVLINAREGAYVKPEKVGFSEELKGIFFSAAILLVALIAHPYFAGVTPFPR